MSATYECENCGNRVSAPQSPGDCPKCGGEMRNVSVARE
ncbi:rubrerythrin-like domain-containing protein [Haladaptatus halobius]|jgi:Zn finger protein HypA/HybF involved in hydrogenase expression|nr:rubrerythrin-like domain-containing protein [Haladaptatus halobius]